MRYFQMFELAREFFKLFTSSNNIEYTLPMKKDNKTFKSIASKQGMDLAS